MMCQPCAIAGFINAEANGKQFESVTDADSIRSMARFWHGKCRDKNCTCQHVLGDMLDRKRVNQDGSQA